jgi:ABC-2 type transport system permease protein
MPLEGFSWNKLGADLRAQSCKIYNLARTSPLWRKCSEGLRERLSGGSGIRREGSPWQGLNTVFLKELSDNLSSVRMRVLELLVVLFGAVVVYFAAEQIRQTTAQDQFLFLRLFAPPSATLLTFTTVLNILVPLMAIGLGFDAINGEYNRRTLSRILAQPIYRDALLLGKFLAGLATLSVSLVTLWLLVIGFGLLRLGIPPSTEELGRSLVFLVITIAYAGVWLSLAMVFSILFRSTATAALVALGVWLFLALLWPALAQPLGEAIAPPDARFAMIGLPTPDTELWKSALARFSPSHLYGEAVVAILTPDEQSLTNVLAQFQGRIIGAPLPLGQSILMAWPQMVALLASMIVLYVIGYVAFQRQEVRA